jgi:serine phosphatase RsbU (regulator of sigma subunit)
VTGEPRLITPLREADHGSVSAHHAGVLAELVLGSWALHPDALPDVVRDAARAMGAIDVVLLVIDLQQQSLSGLGAPAGDSFRRIPVDGSPAGTAFQQRAPVVVPSEDATLVWLPILDSADRLGVLGVTVRSIEDLAGYSALASLTGELLSSKRAYGDGLAIARRTRPISLAAELRWAMLPPLTFVSPEVTVAGILEPAYEIAGDTFDYAMNGSIAHLAIFDAMGHGLEASRMASLAVTSYRHSRRAGQSLAETVASLDEVIADQFGPAKFVTGQVATLDVERGHFRMLNLGHPLPLLIRGGEVVGELECSPSLPAGLGSKAGSTLEVTLEPGDLVLLHTDGITEARRDDEEFGAERFRRVVNQQLSEGQPPEELIRRVVNHIVEFQRHQTRDDATLLAVGWRLPSGRTL